MGLHALYPGSFDPVTFGHIDLIRRASRKFDRVVVAIGTNAAKMPVFTADERVRFLRAEVADLTAAAIFVMLLEGGWAGRGL